MRVPIEVCDELRGAPEVGTADEPAYLFLTTGAEGAPHVCLLSRAQLVADGDGVRAVIYSSGTKANLERTGLACLVVVTAGIAHYCSLVVRRQVARGNLAGYELELRAHRRDEVPGAELRGLRYTVTSGMPEAENWADTRRLIDELSG